MAKSETLDVQSKPTAAFEVREVGIVKSVRELIVRAVGLPSCMNGQMVEFANGARGMVMGFNEHEVQILMLHGVLHLLGHDHETDSGAMARAEKRWRTKLGLPNGLIERVRS